MKYSYIFNKLNLLFKFAYLEDEIAKLSTSKDIIDFLLKIQDSKLKGQAFNFVKTKNPKSVQEVELFLNSIIEKDKKIKELKENTLKSKESNIPDELKSIYNSITYPKLKQLNKNDDGINENLVRNPNLTNEQFNILLSKNDYEINDSLASNPNLTKEQAVKLLKYNPITLTKYFGNKTKNAMLLKNIYQLNKISWSYRW